jgi:hypothetical protein
MDENTDFQDKVYSMKWRKLIEKFTFIHCRASGKAAVDTSSAGSATPVVHQIAGRYEIAGKTEITKQNQDSDCLRLCCQKVTYSLYNHIASPDVGPGAAQEGGCSIRDGFRLEVESQSLHQHGNLP